jgi:hypothetical protein
MCMIPGDFIAAELDYEFDYPRMTREILSCREFFVPTPPYRHQVEAGLSGEIPFMSESSARYRAIDVITDKGVSRKGLHGVNIFYLRNSTHNDVRRDSRFAVTKKLPHESWFWRPELEERIAYTIECIESLPYRTLGLIRVFVCDDTFMPTHRDTVPEAGYDKTKAVGVSLVPATGDVGMLIWDAGARSVREVKGHCLLFDDSKWHGVPMTRGTRITMRIFGDADFAALGGHFRARAALA